jgi:hypothetical protein
VERLGALPASSKQARGTALAVSCLLRLEGGMGNRPNAANDAGLGALIVLLAAVNTAFAFTLWTHTRGAGPACRG